MPDDRSKVGGRDRESINVHDDYELRQWSKKFGVSAEELKKAVQKIGDSAEAVRNHLGKEEPQRHRQSDQCANVSQS